MKTNMNLLNASVMQLRAVATKAASTIELIIDNPQSFGGVGHVDEIVKQTKILADADASIKMLQNSFISPISDQRQKQRMAANNNGQPPALTPEMQEQLEAFTKRHPSNKVPDLYPKTTEVIAAEKEKLLKSPKQK